MLISNNTGNIQRLRFIYSKIYITTQSPPVLPPNPPILPQKFGLVSTGNTFGKAIMPEPSVKMSIICLYLFKFGYIHREHIYFLLSLPQRIL